MKKFFIITATILGAILAHANATISSDTVTYIQGSTGSVTQTLTSKLQKTVNVVDFGATCNGTITTPSQDSIAINAAIAALGNAGGEIDFPAGACMLDSTINIPNTTVNGASKGITLHGQGIATNGGGTTLNATSNNIGIINNASDNFHLTGFALNYSSTPVSGATAIYSSGANSVFDNFYIASAYVGVEITGGTAQFLHHFQVTNYINIGVYIHSVSDTYLDSFILNANNTNSGVTNGTLGGIRLYNKAEAITVSNADILNGAYSITTDASSNSSGQRPAYSKFVNVYFDSSAYGSNLNNLIEFSFTNCWFSGGRTGPGYPGISLNTTDSIRFYNSEFYNNGGDGVLMSANAIRSVFNGNSFESNSTTAGPGAAHGLAIAPGATDFVVENNIFHNGLSGAFNGQQGYGVYVNSGSSNRYTISNNLVSGNLTGGVSDGGTGTSKNVSSNF